MLTRMRPPQGITQAGLDPASTAWWSARNQTPAAIAGQAREMDMMRFIVERAFPDGLEIPTTEEGAHACLAVIVLDPYFYTGTGS